MSIAPVINLLTGIQAQALLLVPIVAILCVIGYALTMMMGDHKGGRTGVIWTGIGTALALGSVTIVGSIKP